LIDKLVVTG